MTNTNTKTNGMTAEQLATMSKEELIQLLQRKEVSGGRIKVSKKGAVSVYGFGRWPVTLYVSQWEGLFKLVDEIKAFIASNRSLLAEKPAKEDEEAA